MWIINLHGMRRRVKKNQPTELLKLVYIIINYISYILDYKFTLHQFNRLQVIENF